ncbi:UNVERIFIED_CONTAM: Cyclic nucleotide-gated ion channel 1 [Sesamum latifolium]|uniref:Cyclic nucleotide-gated ion channel 1 n=1 Tax=Sesamum latifolium TaxID=2727402 RepID=A0AAW2U9C6_9LAMI
MPIFRFEDRNSKSSFTSEGQSNRRLLPWRKPNWFVKGYDERIKSLRKGSLDGDHTRSNRPKSSPTKKVLDPQAGPFPLMWNKFFLISCMIAVFLDPLFFYATAIDAKNLCLSVDEKVQITFRTGVRAPSSRVSGKDELIKDPKAIAKWYLSNYFIVDILSVLPLPQVVILIVIPVVNASTTRASEDLLNIVILAQYIPRIIRITPLIQAVMRTSRIFVERAWASAACGFLCYILVCHVYTLNTKDTEKSFSILSYMAPEQICL